MNPGFESVALNMGIPRKPAIIFTCPDPVKMILYTVKGVGESYYIYPIEDEVKCQLSWYDQLTNETTIRSKKQKLQYKSMTNNKTIKTNK